MSSINAGTDAQEIVRYFYSETKLKIDGSIARHIASVKRLLSKYTKDEIIKSIDICIKNPPQGGIYSFGFVTYNLEKIVTQIRKFELIEKAKEEEKKSNNLKPLPAPSNKGKKLNRFGTRKEVDWNA